MSKIAQEELTPADEQTLKRIASCMARDVVSDLVCFGTLAHENCTKTTDCPYAVAARRLERSIFLEQTLLKVSSPSVRMSVGRDGTKICGSK